MPDKDELYVKYRVFREPAHDSLEHDQIDPVPMKAYYLQSEDEYEEHWADAEEVDLESAFFVLRPKTDKHARVALAAYIESCYDDFPNLAADLNYLLDSIRWEIETGGEPPDPPDEEDFELVSERTLRRIK